MIPLGENASFNITYENELYHGMVITTREPETICDDSYDIQKNVIGNGIWVRIATDTDTSWFEVPLMANHTTLIELDYYQQLCTDKMGYHWAKNGAIYSKFRNSREPNHI
eukprot:UN04163